MEIHGGMYSGDAGQKHNAKRLWNYAFMEMHVDEIGLIPLFFFFFPIILIDIFFKMPVVQFKEVTTL